MPTTPNANEATDAWEYMRALVEDAFKGYANGLESIAATDAATTTAISASEATAIAPLEIETFPIVALALAYSLAMYANGWIVTKIAEVFPNPSIFGFHPLGFIKDGLSALGGVIEAQSLSTIKSVAGPIVTVVHMIAAVVQRVVNVLSAGHNNLADLITGGLPREIGAALATAEGAVSALNHQVSAEVRSALDAMAHLPSPSAAKAILAQALKVANLPGDLAAIGAAATLAAANYTDTVHHQTSGEIAASAAKVAAQAQASIDAVNQQLTAQLAADSTALASLTHEVNVTIPNEIQTRISDAVATEQQRLSAAVTGLQSEIDAIATEITSLQSRITKDEAVIATAQANIANLSTQTGDNAAAIAAEQQTIASAQASIQAATTSIADLNTKITGISNTLAPVQAAQQLNTAQLAPLEAVGAVALPTVLATLSSTLSSLKTKVETCTVDTCDPASPTNIKNVLKDLLGLATAGAEIGFIAQAIHDPLGTADALAPFLDGIDTAAVDTLNTLLSL